MLPAKTGSQRVEKGRAAWPMGAGGRLWALALLLRTWAAQGVTVAIDGLGSVVGGSQPGCETFLGVPYAEPPIGALRWREPQPVRSWAPRTLDGLRWGPVCPQSGGGWDSLNATWTDEACLSLNIFRPRGSSRPWPVFVWIHGGNYLNGGANDAEQNGCDLVRRAGDVVVVTIQYRLGVLGFLGGSAVRAGNQNRTHGSFGLLDQIQALRWVRAHIGAFGGDPSRVVAAGESAGAGSVSALVASPLARGLLSGAIMQSGGFATWTAKTADQAQSVFDDLAARSGCAAATDLSCLRSLDAARLVALGQQLTAYPDTWTDCRWAPTIDGVVLTAHPARAYGGVFAAGIPGGSPEVEDVPLILGSNREDGSWFASLDRVYPSPLLSRSLTARDYSDWLARNFVPESAASAVESAYGPSERSSDWATENDFWGVAQQIVGDLAFICPARAAAVALSETRARATPVYAYYFGGVGPDADYGACHGAEIPYVFAQKAGGTDAGALSTNMVAYWTNFVHFGNPSPPNSSVTDSRSAYGSTLPLPSALHEWPPFSDGPSPARAVLTLGLDPAGAEVGVASDVQAFVCDFWSAVGVGPELVLATQAPTAGSSCDTRSWACTAASTRAWILAVAATALIGCACVATRLARSAFSQGRYSNLGSSGTAVVEMGDLDRWMPSLDREEDDAGVASSSSQPQSPSPRANETEAFVQAS